MCSKMYLEWTYKGQAKRWGFLSVTNFMKNSTNQEKGRSVGLLPLYSLFFKRFLCLCISNIKMTLNTLGFFLVAHWQLWSVFFNCREQHLYVFLGGGVNHCWTHSFADERSQHSLAFWKLFSRVCGSKIISECLNMWFPHWFCVFMLTKSIVGRKV